MKKILIGAIAALAIVGFSSFSEASQAAQENVCCRGGGCYYSSDCADYDGGEYCGRYGCGQDYNRGGR